MVLPVLALVFEVNGEKSMMVIWRSDETGIAATDDVTEGGSLLAYRRKRIETVIIGVGRPIRYLNFIVLSKLTFVCI